MYTTHNSTRKKCRFLHQFSTEFSSTGKGELIVSRTNVHNEEKVKAKKVVGHSPSLRNSNVPILLRPSSPAYLLTVGIRVARVGPSRAGLDGSSRVASIWSGGIGPSRAP